MPNNRAHIRDDELVQPARLLDKGIPLPFLSGRYVVEEGHVAIITEGGAYKEILEPGTHFLDRYHIMRDVKAVKIDTRIKTMTVSLIRELQISQPVPVKINLELAVEYRVSEPRRVAMEMTTPLTSLYDRTIQAVRSSVAHATYDEVRTQGEGIGRTTLQRLQAMQLPRVIGIEVFNVLVTSIEALDAGSDVLARKAQEAWERTQDVEIKQYERVRDWQLEVQMLEGTQVTPAWLMMHRPEIYQQLMAGNTAVLMKMLESGILDPASAMGLPNYQNVTAGLTFGLGGGMPGFPLQPPQQAAMPPAPNYGPGYAPGYGQPQAPGLPAPAYGQPGGYGQPPSTPSVGPSNPQGRMQDELDYLRRQPGAQVEAKPGVDARGIPDGSYDIKAQFPRVSGGRLTLLMHCPAGYPQYPPMIDLYVDGEPTVFHSQTLRRWNGALYLVEIVREARQQMG